MFKIGMKLMGLNRLFEKIDKRVDESKRKDNSICSVGYSAPYALIVHENMEANHPHGQAKFLEQPARQMKDTLAHSIAADAKKGIGLTVANENAAKQLFDASQELVPVETGALKASGFVKDDKGNLLAGSDMTAAEVQAWQQHHE